MGQSGAAMAAVRVGGARAGGVRSLCRTVDAWHPRTRHTVTGVDVALQVQSRPLSIKWSRLAVAAIILAPCWLWIVCTHQVASDFVLIRDTAWALVHGLPAYASHGQGAFVDLNPPLTHVLLLPLAGLSAEAAAWAWRGIDALCFAGAILLVNPQGWRTSRAGWVIAAVLASPATVMDLAAGQIAGVLTLGLAAAWRCRHLRRGGIALGFVVAAKPFLVPVLIWAWRRGERRLAIFGAIGALVSLGLGLVVYGPSATAAWGHALRSVVWTASEFNASLFRFGPVAVALGAVLIAVVALADVAEDWFPLAVIGSLLLSPLGWIYYLWLPAPWLIRRALSAPWSLWTISLWVPAHLALMPPAGFEWLRWSYPVGLVALFVWLTSEPPSPDTQSRSAPRFPA